MRWNRGTLIYTALLVLFLGYYCYCSAVGKAIYGVGDRLVYGGTGYSSSGHVVFVRGFNHK